MNKMEKQTHILGKAAENSFTDEQVAALVLSLINARGENGNTGEIAKDGNADPGKSNEPRDDITEPVSTSAGQGEGDGDGQLGEGEGGGFPPDILELRVRQIIEEATTAKYGNKKQRQEAKARFDATMAGMESEIRRISQEVKLAQATGEIAPRISIQFPQVPEFSTENKHPKFSQLMALLSLPDAIRQPVALVGPAGSGKTTMYKQAAAALQVRYGGLSCSADMTTGALQGWILPIGSGVYVASELVEMFGEPGVFVLDEYDTATPEIIVGLNAPLANGGMHAPLRAFAGLPVYLDRNPDLRLGACLNTFGMGPSALYVGRMQQDAASMDRWLILYIGDDEAMWSRISGKPYTPGKPWVPQQRTELELRAALSEMHDYIWKAKKRVEATNSIKRVISVRSMLRARACLTAGFSLDETKDVVFAGWKDDEKAQALA